MDEKLKGLLKFKKKQGHKVVIVSVKHFEKL